MWHDLANERWGFDAGRTFEILHRVDEQELVKTRRETTCNAMTLAVDTSRI